MTAKATLKTAIPLALLALAGGATRPQYLQGQDRPAHNANPADIGARLASQVRELQGLVISPVPVSYEGKDLAMLGLGSYIVNSVGGCVGCHTSPTFATGGDPYSGQSEVVNARNFLAGGAAFGPFTSRNITPDAKSGKPADLTFEEFMRAMRTGEDVHKKHPQMGPLLQVMPWTEYKKMTDHDLEAVYTYLSAIPHADPAPPSGQ